MNRFPQPRVVVLGASNVSRGLARLAATVRARAGTHAAGPADHCRPSGLQVLKTLILNRCRPARPLSHQPAA